jgi:DNA-binding transcriptional MocR family regulator
MAGWNGNAEQVSPARVAEALPGWAAGGGPLYRRLAAGLRAAVDERRLPGGASLPPERELASALGVSRSTLVAAFEELKRDGRIEARQGSGTWIRPLRRLPDEGNRELIEELEGHAIVRDLGGGSSETIAFTAAAVECVPEVVAAAATLDETTVHRWTRGHGYLPLGLPPLREAVAACLTRAGLPTSADQVLVTSGATQAVLLAARLFIEPGDPVAIESPSYAGAIDVLHAAGGRFLTVDTDRGGARTDQLADVLRRSLPRLVYLVPDFHNPTGAVLSAGRRKQVARLAAEFRMPVVEDIVQTDLWFDRPPPPPIASVLPEAPVLTVGSMSKVFWGGLRIGWLRADPATVARLARLKAVTDFGTPAIDQLVAARLLAQIDEVAARRRAQLGRGLDVLTAALARHLPDWTWERPAGGLSLWTRLPAPRAVELARAAEEDGVAVVPGTTFAPGGQRHADRIRLPFVAPTPVIEEGVRRLAAAWNRVAGQATPPTRQRVVI